MDTALDRLRGVGPVCCIPALPLYAIQCFVCALLNWLILPVSICLYQRLSHACLSTARRDTLPGETADGSLNQLWSKWALVSFWITVENPELIHAVTVLSQGPRGY